MHKRDTTSGYINIHHVPREVYDAISVPENGTDDFKWKKLGPYITFFPTDMEGKFPFISASVHNDDLEDKNISHHRYQVMCFKR